MERLIIMKIFSYVVLALNIGVIPLNLAAGTFTWSGLILNLSISFLILTQLFTGFWDKK